MFLQPVMAAALFFLIIGDKVVFTNLLDAADGPTDM